MTENVHHLTGSDPHAPSGGVAAGDGSSSDASALPSVLGGAYPVGWFDRSPTPGEMGPSVLAGHVDRSGEPGAFHSLRELLPGDEIVVDRADGTRAVFVVDAVEEHPKDQFPSEAVYGDIDHAGPRLITCGGSFDEDTGDYLDDVVVFASLVSGG